MKLTYKQIKQRYFDKVYANASCVECACGCGKIIKSKDLYGRDKIYENGHNNRKYENPTQYKREWNHRHRSGRAIYRAKRVKKLKSELIWDAGGKCLLCGMDFDGECTALFDFHHRDPSRKSFQLNIASLDRYSREKVVKEAKKCDLLCANCHRMVTWDWESIKTEE